MINKIDELLKDIDTVCITGHISPDGDCVGSNLALYTYINNNYPNIRTDVFLEPPTSKLAFIKNFDQINTSYDKEEDYDLIICIDAASKERIGKAVKYFDAAKKTVNIDHHVSNEGFADIDHVIPESSSSCEVLFDLLDKEKIDRDIAIALYTGIVYDTGVFKYSNTSPKTMRIAAELMEFDIPTAFVIDESFYSKTYDENRIYGYAILNSKLCHEGKVIYSYITRETMKEFHVSKSELEGIVSQLRLTKGVECSIFVYELDNGTCKVSLRSGEYVDVNKIAHEFSGGGHVRAAGCVMKGEIMECIERLVEETGKYI